MLCSESKPVSFLKFLEVFINFVFWFEIISVKIFLVHILVLLDILTNLNSDKI